MCKVKLFAADIDILLESDINNWIASHPTIVVKNISFSYVAEASLSGRYKAMVLYEVKTNKL